MHGSNPTRLKVRCHFFACVRVLFPSVFCLTELKCLTLESTQAAQNSSGGDSPCFAEYWLPKSELLQLSGGKSSALSDFRVQLLADDGSSLSVSSVDLSERGIRRFPWLSLNLLPNKLWRSGSFRICEAGAADFRFPHAIVPNRVGGRKNHPVPTDHKPFTIVGFSQSPVIRLDEFLRRGLPSSSDSARARESLDSAGRSRRNSRLEDIIRQHTVTFTRSLSPADLSRQPTTTTTTTTTATTAAAESTSSHFTNRLCNRTALSVFFSELAPENNIVKFPRSLSIFDCVGLCTDNSQSASAHAFLMRTVRQLDLATLADRRTSHSCCVPIEFEREAINLLVRDGPNITIFPITNPTVKRCGCT